MAKRQNRYTALIEKIFFDHHTEGATSLDFTRQEIRDAAKHLKIDLPITSEALQNAFMHKLQVLSMRNRLT